MNATHYFVYTGHSTQTKNKLQEEFWAYLKSNQGTLVKAQNLKEFKKEIIDKSKELNEKYKRCKPLVISFSDSYTRGDFMILGFSFLIYKILPAYERH